VSGFFCAAFWLCGDSIAPEVTSCDRVGDVMGYLSNFGEDGFISYAHNDDDVYGPETLGWVTRLHQDLNQRVRTRLGANIQLWRDSEIRNHGVFSNKIFNRLIKTATFISVLSPSFLNSEWCLREVEAFARNADNDNGVLIDDERSRIFKVEKMPVGRNELPPVMQGTKTYRFYEPHPDQPNRPRELRPFLGEGYTRRYFEQLDELAIDIAALLCDMAQYQSCGHARNDPDRATVYVAEMT
jgi:TIR domain